MFSACNNQILRYSMPKRVQAQIRQRIEAGGSGAVIDQLCLDGIKIRVFSVGMRRLLEGCPRLEYLTLNDCELRSLDGFPHLPRLIGLELADNHIHDEHLPRLAAVPQVNFLALGNNRIDHTTSLRHLKCLPELEILEIQDNECCLQEDYRAAIFALLPSVKVVDRLDRAGHEPEEQASEYISNLGNSRRDLLELLEEEGKEEFAQSGRVRKNSLEQAMAAQPTHFALFHPLSRSATPQKGFLFMRRDHSDSEDEDGLIRTFQRKLPKRDPPTP